MDRPRIQIFLSCLMHKLQLCLLSDNQIYKTPISMRLFPILPYYTALLVQMVQICLIKTQRCSEQAGCTIGCSMTLHATPQTLGADMASTTLLPEPRARKQYDAKLAMRYLNESGTGLTSMAQLPAISHKVAAALSTCEFLGKLLWSGAGSHVRRVS